jgi:CRISPR-associated protein Csm4
MALVAYRLAFKGPIHLGTGREGDLADLDVLPRSDTIASAIIALWRHVAPGASAQEVARIAAEPPFAVSSAMPTINVSGKWQMLFFLPAGIFDRIHRLSGAQRKSLKRVRFGSIESLRSLLNGTMPSGVVARGDALVPADFYGELWTNRSRLRLQVDRMGDRPMDGQLYEFGGVHLANNVCFTVIVDFMDTSCREILEAALALLGDEGIGADRTAGYGAFIIDHIEDRFATDLGTGARLSLSLLHPTRDEIGRGLLDPPAEYLIATRGGWATSINAVSFRRRGINMLAEGSLVKDFGSQRYGDSAMVLEPGELGPSHPVYRLGSAVTLPIKPPGTPNK